MRFPRKARRSLKPRRPWSKDLWVTASHYRQVSIQHTFLAHCRDANLDLFRQHIPSPRSSQTLPLCSLSHSADEAIIHLVQRFRLIVYSPCRSSGLRA